MRLTRMTAAALAALSLIFTAACGQEDTAPATVPAASATGEQACKRSDDPGITQAELEAFEAQAIAGARASRGDGQPALWTLKDDDTTIYILGTVHLLRPDLDWRTDEIDAAIAAADTVVFEADTTSEAAGRELMGFFTSQGLFNDGTQLTSLMTEAEVAVLEEALTQLDLPIEAIQPMRPWYAAINLSVMQMMQEGFDPNAGVETTIEAEVRAHGAALEYLENVEQQLGEFARLDDCEQVGFLLMSAASLEEGTELLDLLVAEWADGDTAGLGMLMSSPDAFGSDATYDAMLKNRNVRWVPQIAGMLDVPGTRLVAVGAGHLAGPDSVITLLRAEGYEVTGP